MSNSANRVFIRFRQMLENRYKQIHTVKEYAAALNVSSKTLTNCVTESSRSTPLKLINDRMVLEAKRRLAKKKPFQIMSFSETAWFSAERRGFEPLIPFRGIHAFQACQFNHSCIFPSLAVQR